MSVYENLCAIPGKSYRGALGRDELSELHRVMARDGMKMLLLNGARMKTVDALFSEFSRAFEFPDYFGNNWNALDECICDLEWLPSLGYCVVIEDTAELLRDDSPTEVETLLRLLQRASLEWGVPVEQGEVWDRPAKPFCVIGRDPIFRTAI